MAQDLKHVLFAASLGLLATIPSVFLDGWLAIPAISVGVALWFAGRLAGLSRAGNEIVGFLVIVVAANASWFSAIEIYGIFVNRLEEEVAGASGALILCLPLLWVWRINNIRLIFLLGTGIAGVLGIELSRIVRAPLAHELLAGDRWLYVLMATWQATVFATAVMLARLAQGRTQS